MPLNIYFQDFIFEEVIFNLKLIKHQGPENIKRGNNKA